MHELTSDPGLEKYLVLAQELMRRIYAGDISPDELHNWLAMQMQLVAATGSENAVLTWPESFDYYEQLLAERKARAALPVAERSELSWAWPAWNRMIDPLEPGLLGVIAGGDGMGKCLAKGTRVVMYDGTLKAVEDVGVGDLLMGPDSTPRRVQALGRGREQMYWIRQHGGIDYRCNASHLLSLLVRDKAGNKRYGIIEAQKVAEMPEWYVRRNLQGYKVPVDWTYQEVELDPYFLGLWLGDGIQRNGAIMASDTEVIDWLTDYAERIGVGVTVAPDNERGTVMRVLVSNGRGGLHVRRGNTPAWKLSKMGLIKNKHIPQEYITNSSDVRLRLLAGLIDSDGYYDPQAKLYEIVQKDEALVRQIKFVADSLGFSTSLKSKRATIKDRGVDIGVWRLRIAGDITRIPVLVERKKASPRLINKDWRVTGFTIEPAGEDDYYGFTLDGDRQFLLEDMTVTHNTVYAEVQAEDWAEKGKRVAFVHFELNRAVMLDRRAARHTGISRRELKAGPFSRETIAKWHGARKRLEAYDGQITYLHTPGWSMERVTERLASLVEAGECDVAIIDYLEKARPSSRQLKLYGTNHWQREADDVEIVKTFAEAAETPILLLAQLSKSGKGQDIDRLDRTAIRGAGEKTEKANIVVLINRKRDDEDGYAPVVDVRIDKNTLGPTGNFQQVMDGEHFRVGDMLAEPGGYH